MVAGKEDVLVSRVRSRNEEDIQRDIGVVRSEIDSLREERRGRIGDFLAGRQRAIESGGVPLSSRIEGQISRQYESRIDKKGLELRALERELRELREERRLEGRARVQGTSVEEQRRIRSKAEAVQRSLDERRRLAGLEVQTASVSVPLGVVGAGESTLAPRRVGVTQIGQPVDPRITQINIQRAVTEKPPREPPPTILPDLFGAKEPIRLTTQEQKQAAKERFEERVRVVEQRDIANINRRSQFFEATGTQNFFSEPEGGIIKRFSIGAAQAGVLATQPTLVGSDIAGTIDKAVLFQQAKRQERLGLLDPQQTMGLREIEAAGASSVRQQFTTAEGLGQTSVFVALGMAGAKATRTEVPQTRTLGEFTLKQRTASEFSFEGFPTTQQPSLPVMTTITGTQRLGGMRGFFTRESIPTQVRINPQGTITTIQTVEGFFTGAPRRFVTTTRLGQQTSLLRVTRGGVTRQKTITTPESQTFFVELSKPPTKIPKQTRINIGTISQQQKFSFPTIIRQETGGILTRGKLLTTGETRSISSVGESRVFFSEILKERGIEPMIASIDDFVKTRVVVGEKPLSVRETASIQSFIEAGDITITELPSGRFSVLDTRRLEILTEQGFLERAQAETVVRTRAETVGTLSLEPLSKTANIKEFLGSRRGELKPTSEIVFDLLGKQKIKDVIVDVSVPGSRIQTPRLVQVRLPFQRGRGFLSPVATIPRQFTQLYQAPTTRVPRDRTGFDVDLLPKSDTSFFNAQISPPTTVPRTTTERVPDTGVPFIPVIKVPTPPGGPPFVPGGPGTPPIPPLVPPFVPLVDIGGFFSPQGKRRGRKGRRLRTQFTLGLEAIEGISLGPDLLATGKTPARGFFGVETRTRPKTKKGRRKK